MGIYGLTLLFLGILIIGLVYARTATGRIYHYILFAIILSLFLIFFFPNNQEKAPDKGRSGIILGNGPVNRSQGPA